MLCNVSEICCRIESTILIKSFTSCSPKNDLNQMDDKKPVIDFAIIPGYEMYDCMSVKNNWLFFYEFFPYKSYFKKLFNFIFQLVSGRHVLQHYFLLHLWTTFLRKTKNSRISWGTSIPICFHIPFYQFNKRLFIVRGPR